MTNLFDLAGKVVLITGGYGYLGKAISLGLSESGANVVVLGRDENKFLSAFQEEKAQNISFVACDVTSTSSVKEAFERVFSQYKRIDVLINNAASVKNTGRPESVSDSDWQFTMDGVSGCYYRCMREVFPYFQLQSIGKIINIASMYGVVSPNFEIYKDCPQFTNPPQYGAAKAGVVQLTKYFASYWGRQGILVNCVSPGPFPSKQVQENALFVENLQAKTMLGRIGTPDDLKGIMILLSSDASNYIQGQNIMVDGGWTAW
jgi:gluconate 5-dehydrogenase